jgi:fucose 4-O-acetylase-like acetyltransferase
MDRNRYADLLRVVAIGGVVYGHWLVISITDTGGQLSGVDALGYVPWAQWLTWLFQVMPVFFLVGGYVNALSWRTHRDRGESWTQWVRHRALRLLPPTAVFVVAGAIAVTAARLAGVPSAEVAAAGWLVTLQLWFLPVYLLLIALTPALLAAHDRCGLAVPAAMAVAAALVNAGTLGLHVPGIGYANFLFVWGSVHQWGFSWLDGTLTRRRWRPAAMAVGGAALFGCLLAWAPFSVDMIGSGNTNPPSVALLAFALTQSGLVLSLEPAVTRLLQRPRLWRLTQRLNATTMTVYLWHFVPPVIIAVACYPTGVLPQPAVGTGEWWLLRLAWWGLLTVVLVPLVAVVMRAERWLPRLPAGVGPAGPWSPALLAAGLLAVGVGLTKLAVGGLDPGGRAPAGVLATCAAGLLASYCTGRVPGGEDIEPEREITVRSG